MKELFESAYYSGYQQHQDDCGEINNPISYQQWFESNKDNIDSAIEKYLQEQGKKIVETYDTGEGFDKRTIYCKNTNFKIL